jgi:hypothetical protein
MVRSEWEGGWINTIKCIIHDRPRTTFPLGHYTSWGDLESGVSSKNGIWEY